MHKLVALYKKPSNPQEFETRYFNEHVPLAKKMPGLKDISVSKIYGGPMGESELYMMAELFFESEEALKAALSSPEGREAGKNIMSFAKDILSMHFARVEDKVPVNAG